MSEKNNENVGLTFLFKREEIFPFIVAFLGNSAIDISESVGKFGDLLDDLEEDQKDEKEPESAGIAKLIHFSDEIINELESTLRRMKEARNNAEGFLNIDKIREAEEESNLKFMEAMTS